MLGNVYLVPIGKRRYVANMYTQLKYGYDGKQYTDYSAIEEAFTYLNDFCKRHNLTLAMPYKVGSVRGGANWDIVYDMMDRIFKDTEVTLYELDLG